MPKYLVTISLGPVQSLIDAARRTRDLWCGSWLLSEVALAASAYLDGRQPGCLIFPSPQCLERTLNLNDSGGDGANIGNVLRAEVSVPDGDVARNLCEGARRAATKRLRALGNDARGRLRDALREDVWESQIDDILECYIAWVPIRHSEGYRQASSRLGGLLAARKQTRDFKQCTTLRSRGLPKSSLDGARETVLPHPDQWSNRRRTARRLGLSEGEQLDALGVIKRLAGDSDQFTAISRIAADPWIGSLTASQRERLNACYSRASVALRPLGLCSRVEGNGGIYSDLPFDAQLLFRSRHERAAEKVRSEGSGDAWHAIRELQNCVNTISQVNSDARSATGTPLPYVAVLRADGDRMGELLSRSESANDSRIISDCLHDFAANAKMTVRRHRGHCTYAGGDDVHALLPVSSALDCAKELSGSFKNAFDRVAIGGHGKRPTLSVGIGIGHLMEPLGSLRNRAARAEQEAKGNDCDKPRNAVAIILGVRAGSETYLRVRWDGDPFLEALSELISAYRAGRLSTRVAYDIQAIDRRMPWLRRDRGEEACGMRTAELERTLDRARRQGGNERIPSCIRNRIRDLSKKSIQRLADTLIVARWLAACTSEDLGGIS